MKFKSLPEITTPKELASYLKISEITVKRALRTGELTGFKAGRDWRIEKQKVIEWLQLPIENSEENGLLILDNYHRSPIRGSGASRPKLVFTSPKGAVYFKFGMETNEICAELFAYSLAIQLGIDIAETRLAELDGKLGIASYDIGVYEEPTDRYRYSVKDFIHVSGFIQMCLFDYLIMNEDRHAGNWGISNGTVAPLFDHNYAFGGDEPIQNIDKFMLNVTTPFYVDNENMQRHDTILEYFVQNHSSEVDAFLQKLQNIDTVSNELWEENLPNDCARLNAVLSARIEYMTKKVDEYRAK